MSRTIQGIILALCCVLIASVMAAPAPQTEEGTVLFFNYDGHHPQYPVRHFTYKTADDIANEIISEYTPQRNPGGFPPGFTP